MVGLLLEKKVPVNEKGKDGQTALHLAASEGHTTVAKLLLASGADTNVKDSQGENATDLAEKRGEKEVAEAIRTFEAVAERKRQSESTFEVPAQATHDDVNNTKTYHGIDLQPPVKKICFLRFRQCLPSRRESSSWHFHCQSRRGGFRRSWRKSRSGT